VSNVISIILGGGKGARLYPLTKERAKPAVPFGAKYRIVDIPISNSINSGFRQMYVLTQFNSASLHLHLASTYIFDQFSPGFVEILAAEQTYSNSSWYEGTADAVRKNLQHFRTQQPSHYVILSGDQLYRMDLRKMYEQHIESGAEITVACTPVTREVAADLGILDIDSRHRITEFVEKPPLERDISHLGVTEREGIPPQMKETGRIYLASMGIYIFSAERMETALDNSMTDFGKEIIPRAIDHGGVYAYVFDGFWEDIGTIRNFYETNLDLADINPAFNFYDEQMPIYTRRRDLPASKFNSCRISNTLAADGCVITDSTLSGSIVGIRTFIESGSELDGVVLMGADYYETDRQKADNRRRKIPDLGIGRNTKIRNAIIDKNARVGNGVQIGYANDSYTDGDFEHHFVRDGIIIIPKGGVVPDGAAL